MSSLTNIFYTRCNPLAAEQSIHPGSTVCTVLVNPAFSCNKLVPQKLFTHGYESRNDTEPQENVAFVYEWIRKPLENLLVFTYITRELTFTSVCNVTLGSVGE